MVILGCFIIWRILLFFPLFFYNGIKINSYYLFQGVNNSLLSVWANFDGVHYLNIADNGYTNNGRFMPLYPLMIRVFHFLPSWLVGLSLSNLFFLLSLWILFKLFKFDYEKKTIYMAIFFLMVFPTSFFFGSVYSESLFLLLILSSFYFARQKKWFLAGVLAALSSATRIVGIVMFFALLIELYLQRQKIDIKKMLAVSISFLGTIIYAVYNKLKWGDYLYFLKAHGELGNSRSTNSIILFPQTIYRYFKILSSLPFRQFEWWIALLELSMFIFALTLIIIGWRKKIRYSYLIYALGALFIPASSGTFSGLPRYIIPIFPIFLAMSLIKNKFIKITFSIASLVLSVILLMFFARGYFVA